MRLSSANYEYKQGGCYDIAKRRKVRLKNHHKRDFDLYVQFGDMLSRVKCKEIPDPNGYTPLECFTVLDSTNERLPCTDPEMLEKAICGKRNINLQIKMWVEGILDGTTPLFEIREWIKDYPKWVLDAILKQLGRIN